MNKNKKTHKEFWYSSKEQKAEEEKAMPNKLKKTDNPIGNMGEYTFGGLWKKKDKKERA